MGGHLAHAVRGVLAHDEHDWPGLMRCTSPQRSLSRRDASSRAPAAPWRAVGAPSSRKAEGNSAPGVHLVPEFFAFNQDLSSEFLARILTAGGAPPPCGS